MASAPSVPVITSEGLSSNSWAAKALRCSDQRTGTMEDFSQSEVHHAVREALRLGRIGLASVKHLLLC